ncbi:HolB ATPase involved in DNA replication [uncultured Caudovirales phage]|uniref:Sliding-clamp-loader large subunit n=1 Tax=uncultured Caudovirales phage TaxID=2100421 RepID=A0A6J5M501_9CAUD|nr:HolB ATPase involved in DNA replication [uncultured Caudovirales phage]
MSEAQERKHIVWMEKYRPHTIDECILPKNLKDIFKGIVESEELPHMLFCGTAGVGKTTVAKALCEELDYTYILINASDDRNIDTLRTTVKQFASSLSFNGRRKVIILDEADYLNVQSFQPALRGVMEEFSKNCSFILTCNFKNKIIDPLQSRCSVKEFRIPKEEKKTLIENCYKRIVKILDEENVEYDGKALAAVVVKYFPDFRRLLNELQAFSKQHGKIDEGILSFVGDINITRLYKALKEKNFAEVRQWVVENLDNDSTMIYRKIYDHLKENIKPSSIPNAIVIIAKYMNTMVADSEINLMACLIELGLTSEFV